MIFGINIFPSDVYYLEKMPSEINFISVCIIFFLSLLITSLASYFPAKTISKMKTQMDLNMNKFILILKI